MTFWSFMALYAFICNISTTNHSNISIQISKIKNGYPLFMVVFLGGGGSIKDGYIQRADICHKEGVVHYGPGFNRKLHFDH